MKSTVAVILIYLLLVACAGVALAASWDYEFPASITDNSTTNRLYYPVLLGYGPNPLINQSYMTDNGSDTNMQISSTDVKYMISTDNFTAVIPNFPANGTVTVDLYTGYSPEQSSYSMVFGDDGYLTVLDDSDIEMTDNATLVMENIYLDTSVTTNVTVKENALYIETGSGNVTATAYGLSTNTTQLIYTQALLGLYTPRRGAEYINDFPASVIYRVDFYLSKNSSPTGNLTARIRDTSDTLLGTLGTYLMQDVGAGGEWVTFNANPIRITETQDLRICIEADGGNGSNYIYVYGDDAAGYANGVSQWYDGASWADTAQGGNPDDMAFRVYYYDPVTANITVVSGEYDLELTLDTTNITLELNSGTYSDSMALGGASVNDNSSDWIFLQDVPYCDNIQLSVDGTLQGWYQPNDILASTALPDRQGGDHNGTVTWGTNTYLTISYGEMTSYESTISASSATGGFDLQSALMPSTWFAMGENVEDLPFYDMVYNAVNAMDFPDVTEGIQTIYFIVIVGIAFAVFVGLAVFTRSALVAFLGLIIVLIVGSSMTIIPMWIIFAVAVVGFGIMFLYRQVAY